MGSSSFLNAFRLIKRKPVLLLLLLPLQLAMPLVSRLMPLNVPNTAGDFADSAGAMSGVLNVYSSMFGMIGIILLLYILAGIFLIPPAMELLHDGAQDSQSSSGWYGRAMAKHWWKPVSIGAIEVAILFVFYIFFVIIFAIIAVASAGQGLGSAMLNGDEAGLTSMVSMAIPILIIAFIFLMVVQLVISFFAMMLPATADRGFGESFKALFSGNGFKKVMKVFGVYLLTDIINVLIIVLFAVAYMLLSGSFTSEAGIQGSYLAFLESWTYYFAAALASFIVLFKYGYVFSVFQEIKNREAQAIAPQLLSGGPAQGGEGL